MNVLDSVTIPIPFCNPNITLTLPGDGSITGLADVLGNKITEEATQAVLRKLGLKVSIIFYQMPVTNYLKKK